MFLHPHRTSLRVTGLLKPGSRTAFSLVEVVTAMAIFAFAMASMLALLPSGLLDYQKAQNATAYSQIVQNVTSDVQLIGLQSLITTDPNTGAITAGPTNMTNYFDDQGSPVQSSDPMQVFTAISSFQFLGANGPLPQTVNNAATLPLTSISEKSGVVMKVDVIKLSGKLLQTGSAKTLAAATTNTFSTIISY